MQAIDPPDGDSLQVISLSDVPIEDREGVAQGLIRDFLTKSIDPSRGPLFEPRLYEIAADDFVLAIQRHHAISDADSAQLLARELWSLYYAYTHGQPSPLQDVKIQYADYADWQLEQRACWNNERGPYWRRKLEHAQRIELPRDYDNDTPCAPPGSLTFTFDRALSADLHSLAQRERIMPSMVKLAAYAVLLSRWTGQDDFVIPFVFGGRFTARFASVMGLLSQFLPIRIRITGDESFSDLARTTAEEFAAAVRHLDFGRVFTDSSDLLEGTSLNCISGNSGTRPHTDPPRDSDYIRVEPFPVDTGLPQGGMLPADMLYHLFDTDAGIWSWILYRSDRFKHQTMERFLEHQQLLWTYIVHNPRVRTSWLRTCM